MPSISVKIWLITLSPAPPPSPTLPPRDLAMESSSSKKSTQGAACLAYNEKYIGTLCSIHLAVTINYIKEGGMEIPRVVMSPCLYFTSNLIE